MKKKDQAIQFNDLYIPTPCHEDWDQMSATERGRFCASCEKEVFDFRDGDREKLQKLWNKSEGKLCGRFFAKDLGKQGKKECLGFRLPIFVKKKLSRIAFSLLTITGIQNTFGKQESQFFKGDLGFIETHCDTSIGMEAQGFAVWHPTHPEEENQQFLYPHLETKSESKPEEEETETDKEVPQKAPIIPILNRMPALHKKRQTGEEKDKSIKLPWR